MDIISRLSGCAGQAADVVSAYTQVNMKDAPELLRIPKNRNVQTFGFVYYDTNGLNHGPVSKTQSFLLSGGWHKIGWKETKYWSDVESTQQEVDVGEPTSFLDHVYLGCTQRQCEISKDVVITEPCLNPWFPREQLKKLPYSKKSSYLFVVPRCGKSCQEKCGTILCIGRLNNSTQYQLHALMTIISKMQNWNLWENCRKYALKLFWNAYTWHVLEDLIFYGQWANLHDRSQNGPKHVTNAWIVWSLTFIIHVTTNNVGNTAKQCRLGLFQDSDFCGRSWGLKIHFRWNIMHFGKSYNLFQSVGRVRNKLQFSHSFTEAEIISLHAGLRLDGIPALYLWDLIVLVLGNIIQTHDRREKLVVCRDASHPQGQQSRGMFNVLNNVDRVPSNVHSSRQEALLYIFEDNEPVIRMIIKGRSPTMRHVSRTHRIALDGLFDGINLDPTIQIKNIDTKNKLADILTMGNYTRDEWINLLCLFNVSHFSFTNCSEVMSKRTLQDAGESQ